MSTPGRFHTIHVFVLLPEPLDLPSGFAIQRENRPGTYTGESFRVWEGADLTVDDLLGGPISRFFHRQAPVDLSRTSAAVSLARWAWPSLAPEDPTGSPETDGTAEAGAEEPVKMQTAVELIHVVGCPEPRCSGQVGEEFFERTLHHGLRMVQALQRAIYAMKRQPYTLLTKASAAFVTPVAIGHVSTLTGDYLSGRLRAAAASVTVLARDGEGWRAEVQSGAGRLSERASLVSDGGVGKRFRRPW